MDVSLKHKNGLKRRKLPKQVSDDCMQCIVIPHHAYTLLSIYFCAVHAESLVHNMTDYIEAINDNTDMHNTVLAFMLLG